MSEKKEYVKLWLSYKSYFEAYSAAEVGRLVLAMIEYRESGASPEFSGSERFIWPAIRRDIDESIKAQEASAETNRENGKKGGRPKKAEETEENPKNPSGFLETEKSHGQGQRTKDKDKGQGQYTPKPPNGRFVPPTVEEVADYCKERGNNVDPQHFVDHYTSNGWKVGGRGAMKDWKAAVRNWEKNGFSAKKKSPNNMAGQDFNASTERIRKNGDWLDEFLAGQEEA